MERPILLVDIDGVINLFGNLGTSLVSIEQEYLALDRYTIRIPEGVRDSLHRLQEVFDPVWCTTWEGDAHPQIGIPLGLSEWPFIDFGEKEQGSAWKLNKAIETVGDRPCGWIEDELDHTIQTWAEYRNQTIPTLLISTRPNYGLEPQHVEKLTDWASQLK